MKHGTRKCTICGGTGYVHDRRTKLTVEQVDEIRHRYLEGDDNYRELAAEYGVTMSTISRIVNGKR